MMWPPKREFILVRHGAPREPRLGAVRYSKVGLAALQYEWLIMSPYASGELIAVMDRTGYIQISQGRAIMALQGAAQMSFRARSMPRRASGDAQSRRRLGFAL